MEQKEEIGLLRRYLGVFRYSRRAIDLVWETSPTLTIVFALLTVLGGLLPPSMAWVGKEIIDAVLLAIETTDTDPVVFWIALEAGLITLSPVAVAIHSPPMSKRVGVLAGNSSDIDVADTGCLSDSGYYPNLVQLPQG